MIFKNQIVLGNELGSPVGNIGQDKLKFALCSKVCIVLYVFSYASRINVSKFYHTVQRRSRKSVYLDKSSVLFRAL